MSDQNGENAAPQITEQIIYIDTRDRKMDAFLNPFHFTVEFGPLRDSSNIGIPVTLRDIYYIRMRTIVLPVRLVAFPIDRYFICRIKELDMPLRYHSNTRLNPATDVILYNVGTNGPSLYLECRTDIRLPTGFGRRFQKLTFEFLDSTGQPLIANTNAIFPNPDNWPSDIIVYRHLLPSHLQGNEFPPETDPYQMLNNALLELHLGATTR